MVVKTSSKKKEFSRLDLSLSSLTVTPLWDRDVIEEPDLLSFFTVFQNLFWSLGFSLAK